MCVKVCNYAWLYKEQNKLDFVFFLNDEVESSLTDEVMGVNDYGRNVFLYRAL